MILLALHSSGEQNGALSLWRSYPREAELAVLIPGAQIIGAPNGGIWCEDLQSLVATVENAEAVIATDNGILALALALGKPTVAIFGPTDERVIAEQFWQYTDIRNVAVVRSSLLDDRCERPCNFQYERGFERGGKCASGRADCITEIEPAQIAEALKSVL